MLWLLLRIPRIVQYIKKNTFALPNTTHSNSWYTIYLFPFFVFTRSLYYQQILYYILQLSTTFLDFFACLCQAAQHVFSIKNQEAEAAANVEICTLTAGKKEYQIQKLSISYDICITRLYVRYILCSIYVTPIFKDNHFKKNSRRNSIKFLFGDEKPYWKLFQNAMPRTF